MRIYKKITLIVSLFLTAGLSAQGLRFKGMEKPIDARTSYEVFVSRIPVFKDILKIEFSLAMYMPSDFGYILRVKNTDDERIFNLLYSGERWDSSYPLRFNEEGKSSIIKADVPHDYFEMGKWMDVCIEFRMADGCISMKIDDFEYETYVNPMSDEWAPVINFGKSDYMIDVPSVAIKDLRISDNEKTYRFPLNETSGEKVHERRNSRIYGTVSNPEWLMQKAYEWEQVARFSSHTRAGSNYDPFRKSVVYYNKDSVYFHNLIDKSSHSIRYGQTCPVELYLGSSFINPLDSLLYIYEPYAETIDTEEPTVASYDPESNMWTVASTSRLPIRFHHHSSYIDKERKRFVLYGGFGSMIYNGNFYSYDLVENVWQKDIMPTGNVIYPRYFCSMGHCEKDDALYIFGGMGNESGEQIVGRHYFFDLHRLDLVTGKNRIVWGEDTILNWQEENMVPVRNMIIEEDGFYTVCYPEFHTNSYLQLFYFDFEKAEYQKLSNKVPIRSDKISTNANIYFDEELQIFILTVMESSDDVSSEIKIYTLSFPPLSDEEYLAMTKKVKPWILNLSFLLLLSTCLSFILYEIFRRKRKKEAMQYRLTGRKRYIVEQSPNSICLFGGFSALDTDGKEVQFPYQQRKLLCLIIKYSLDKGISSNRLSKIMWPDKSEEKVKNSRGVAINHLRKLLDNFKGVSLVFEDSHFKLECSDDFSCDWIDFKTESMLDKPDMDKIMQIVSRGKFMKLTEDPIFDSFKEKTETLVINLLTAELAKSFEKKEYQSVTDIAEVVFYNEPLNEQALIWQLNAFVKMRRSEDALIRYSAFVKEYKATYDADYEHDFKSLMR